MASLSNIRTPSELLALAFSGQQNQVPAAGERAQAQTHMFLMLAPTTSASYPKSTVVKAEEGKPAIRTEEEEALAINSPIATATPAVPGEQKARRSSSLSSDESVTQKKRFLRLGPVHFGAGQGDWSEEVVG